jgi:hypothetical protein
MGVSGRPYCTAALHPRPDMNVLKKYTSLPYAKNPNTIPQTTSPKLKPELKFLWHWRQNGKRKDSLGTQDSLLSQLFLIILPKK